MLFRSEIVSSQIDNSLDGEEIKPIDSLYSFCRASEDLIRAFWLGTLCRQAIYEVATDKETKTYGKIDRAQIIDRWDVLLRQLRVCLLVSLRLFGSPLGAQEGPGGFGTQTSAKMEPRVILVHLVTILWPSFQQFSLAPGGLANRTSSKTNRITASNETPAKLVRSFPGATASMLCWVGGCPR